MRKPQTSRKGIQLENLPPAQKDALASWLLKDSLTYPKAQAQLQKEFGVRTSPASLCKFYQKYCAARLSLPPTAPAAPIATHPGAAILEIVVELSQPNIVRLKIIPGSGVQIIGGTA